MKTYITTLAKKYWMYGYLPCSFSLSGIIKESKLIYHLDVILFRVVGMTRRTDHMICYFKKVDVRGTHQWNITIEPIIISVFLDGKYHNSTYWLYLPWSTFHMLKIQKIVVYLRQYNAYCFLLPLEVNLADYSYMFPLSQHRNMFPRNNQSRNIYTEKNTRRWSK